MADLNIRLRLDNAQHQRATEDARRAVVRLRDEHGRFVGEHKQGVAAAEKGGSTIAKGFNLAAGGAEFLNGKLQGVAVNLLAMTGLGSVVSTITAEFDTMARSVLEATKFLDGYHESMLELAALKGNLGGTTAEIREDLGFRQQTLQTRDEAREFQLAAIGAGESQIGKRITQDEFDKALLGIGRFQTANQLEPEQAGQLLGMLPMLMGKETVTSADMIGQMQQLKNIWQPGGGSFSEFTAQLLEGASLTTSGAFENVNEQAAVQAMFSLVAPGAAGTRTEWLTRATLGGLGRMRSAQMMEGVGADELEKQGQYLAGIGATDEMTVPEIATLITADLREFLEKNPDVQPLTYFRSKGFGNKDDVTAILDFMGFEDEYRKTFKPLAEAAPDPDAAMKAVESFKATPMGRQRLTMLGEEAAQVGLGVGADPYEKLMRAQFNLLKGKEESVLGMPFQGSYEDWVTSWMPGKQSTLRAQAHETLLGEERRFGLPEGEMPGAFAGPGTYRKEFRTRLQRIEEAGGDPVALLTEQLVKISQRSLEVQERNEARVKAGDIDRKAPVIEKAKPPLRKPVAPQAGPAR